MNIFWQLVLAHLLADFTFQTDYIAKWKRTNIFGGIAHSAIFFVCAAALCFGELGRTWQALGNVFSLNGWVALALLSFFHFLEDEWRVWAIKKFNQADSFVFFLLDQAIHIMLIIVLFPLRGVTLPEKWVTLAILFVLTTHFASIFIYFLEKAITGSAQLDQKHRYYFMAERLAVGLALLLPGYWMYSFVAVWLPRLITKSGRLEYKSSQTNIIAGNVFAILIGITARFVFY